MPWSMSRTEDPYNFLDLVLGYYMTGRFAVINGLYVAPNLMHHSRVIDQVHLAQGCARVAAQRRD